MKRKKLLKSFICLSVFSSMMIGQLSDFKIVYATNNMINESIDIEQGAFNVDSLTLQPGETTSSVNLNWYAPEGTTIAKLKFGDKIIEVKPQSLTAPTKLDNNKYKDTGKMVCKVTISDLHPQTTYEYSITYDGVIWSNTYKYTTPSDTEFTFGFISDPQIKENGETNLGGWNPSDETNQTGWAKMMEVLNQNNVNLIVSAGDQVEDQSWGKTSEYESFFEPEEMTSIPFAPAVGNHDRHYMFRDHFNLPNQMDDLTEVKTTFRGQNSGSSQSHGNYIKATDDEKANQSDSNGVKPNEEGYYDFEERRIMETEGNYYYLYNNVLFITLNTGAYPGGNDEENKNNSISAQADNKEAEEIVNNFRKTIDSAINKYQGEYQWIIVAHHKSTQTVAKHAADSDIENYVDAGFEKLMDEYDVDFVLGGHDHVYSRSYVLKDGQRNSERLDNINDPDGTIYLTANCSSDMQYYDVHTKLDKNDNEDYPVLANGERGSEAYLKGEALPIGNQEWNQEYSPSYALFDVKDNTISVKVYNLNGDSNNPESKQIDSFTVTKNSDGGMKINGFVNDTASLELQQSAVYDSGEVDKNDAVIEGVAYNKQTGWAYSVNGKNDVLTAIAIKDLENKDNIDLLDGNYINIKSLVEENDEEFQYGYMTSVSVSNDGETLAVTIEDEYYDKNGRVAIFECNEDGTIQLKSVVEVGVQPTNIVYTMDDKQILIANKGEAREGYDSGLVDPKGSISIINLSDYKVNSLDFTSFDQKRDELVQEGIIIKKDISPSIDFEPEYIAVSNTKAYITLQEANAIAVLDFKSQEIIDIYSAGYEDYSEVPIDIDKKDKEYNSKTYESLKGIRMPNGISVKTINGVDYIVTANEGESRVFGNYTNEDERDFGKNETSPTGKITSKNSVLTDKVVFFDSKDYDGLNSENDYLFGGRSMTIFKVDDESLTEVYTSKDNLEYNIAKYLKSSIDNLSGEKGSEAKSITIGTVDNNIYAFIGLGKVGGVIVYDITEQEKSHFVNYINSSDFTDGIVDDISPEGLVFVESDGKISARLISAYGSSGTVGVYNINYEEKVVVPDVDESTDTTPETTPDLEEEVKPTPEENPTLEEITDAEKVPTIEVVPNPEVEYQKDIEGSYTEAYNGKDVVASDDTKKDELSESDDLDSSKGQLEESNESNSNKKNSSKKANIGDMVSVKVITVISLLGGILTYLYLRKKNII